MAYINGKLTKKLVENLGPGRHGDGGGLHLVVDPSGARRWIVRVTVKGQRNKMGAPLRTDFGLGGADIVTLNQARERALEYARSDLLDRRRMLMDRWSQFIARTEGKVIKLGNL